MKRSLPLLAALAALAALALGPAGSAGEGPARLRLDEINALLKGGDEGRLTAYVESAFTPAMRKAGPGDPGILPFLLDLSRGTAVSRSCARWGTGRRA